MGDQIHQSPLVMLIAVGKTSPQKKIVHIKPYFMLSLSYFHLPWTDFSFIYLFIYFWGRGNFTLLNHVSANCLQIHQNGQNMKLNALQVSYNISCNTESVPSSLPSYWLTDWVTDWLTDWLTDWQADWSWNPLSGTHQARNSALPIQQTKETFRWNFFKNWDSIFRLFRCGF